MGSNPATPTIFSQSDEGCFPDNPPTFFVQEPVGRRVPVVASLPHSGCYVPPYIAAQFTEQHRNSLRNTDWYLPSLYSFLPDLGITVQAATHSRYVVDLNRDPRGNLFGDFRNTLIAERTAQGDAVYQSPPNRDEMAMRIGRYYTPYHVALRQNIDNLIGRFGRVVLLDLHAFMGPITEDVCLGNRNGQTCDEQTFDFLAEAFTYRGMSVARNSVYAGGYITRAYADRSSVETLQIELRTTNYLQHYSIDAVGQPCIDDAKFVRTQKKLKSVMASFCSSISDDA